MMTPLKAAAAVACRRALRVTLAISLAAVHVHGPALAQSGMAPSAPAEAAAEQISPFGDGKRVALLIGQSDYANAPLPSATADVAMLAGQLNAAGFDVDSAGDLPEQGIAERVRGLVDRLVARGGDSTAVVYVSGRFAQINGENILLPVGAPIQRASDAALNGFNVRKLFSALESVPAKTRIVIFDAGPAPPALAKEAGFAPGLAIFDPPQGFIVSYSQGPNRHLIDPTSKPGPYSQALFAEIVKSNASIEDILRNVRLRVHAETNGLQSPWEAGQIRGQDFAFYASAEAAAPSQPVVRSLSSPQEVKALSREDAYKAVVAEDSIRAYQSFIEAYPEDEATPSLQYGLAVRREAEVWARATRLNTPEAYWTYISTYPDGGNVYVARERLVVLGRPASPPVGFAPVVYSDLPPPLVGREIIASSASMPLELAPRAPKLQLPPTPVLVATAAAAAAAAIAVPALMNRGGGRQIPAVPTAAVRPTWAAPPPAARAVPAVGAPGALSPARAGLPGGSAPQGIAPNLQQPGGARPLVAPGGAPGLGQAAGQAAAPQSPAVRPLTGGPGSGPGAAPSAGPAAPAVRALAPAGGAPASSPQGAGQGARSLSGQAGPSAAPGQAVAPVRPITGPAGAQPGAPQGLPPGARGGAAPALQSAAPQRVAPITQHQQQRAAPIVQQQRAAPQAPAMRMAPAQAARPAPQMMRAPTPAPVRAAPAPARAACNPKAGKCR
jgi:uncharacterized caspase-like protein